MPFELLYFCLSLVAVFGTFRDHDFVRFLQPVPLCLLASKVLEDSVLVSRDPLAFVTAGLCIRIVGDLLFPRNEVASPGVALSMLANLLFSAALYQVPWYLNRKVVMTSSLPIIAAAYWILHAFADRTSRSAIMLRQLDLAVAGLLCLITWNFEQHVFANVSRQSWPVMSWAGFLIVAAELATLYGVRRADRGLNPRRYGLPLYYAGHGMLALGAAHFTARLNV